MVILVLSLFDKFCAKFFNVIEVIFMYLFFEW